MSKQEIKITVLNFDKAEDTKQFQIEVTNGICSTYKSASRKFVKPYTQF